jgi:diaminohydroxyphosphoribosylaminopyrimidine deaminase/5-amino-6-(5-phosphoribosylamino)uracil reductase
MEFRREVDAIVIGTGTLYADDPTLNVRPDQPTQPDAYQPLRVVMGERDVPAGAKVTQAGGGALVHVRSHDPREVLRVLAAKEVRHVLIEGGATVATAFLRAGLVDDLRVYQAPILLGAGKSAVGDFGVATLNDAPRWVITETERLGPDVFIAARRPADVDPLASPARVATQQKELD